LTATTRVIWPSRDDRRVWVLRGNGTGGFRPVKRVAYTDCCGGQLITADLNRDARTDMILPNGRKGVSVLLNTSNRRVRR
jgi:hypothetical protein